MSVPAFGSSILFISFLVIMAFVTAMLVRVQHRSDRRLAVIGTVANVTAMLGLLGYALMSSPPDPWATRLTNLCIALAIVCCSYATVLAVKRRPLTYLFIIWFVVLQALTAWYTLVDNQIMVRSNISSGMIALLLGYITLEVLIAYARDRNTDYFFFAGVVAAGCGVMIYRMTLGIQGTSLRALEVRDFTLALALVTLFVLMVVWNLAMYVLLIGEYQRQLQTANAELEQRVAERTHELHLIADELRQANAGKDAFMAAVSHELRTPLMGVLSMNEVLETGLHGPLSPGQSRCVAAIAASGQRLLALVNRVLLYTQLVGGARPIQHETCQLAYLCAAAVRAVQAGADRKQQHIGQVVEPGDLEITSDPEGILNILKMLLDNAVKFTPEDGRIDVSIRDTANAVQITVSDTGVGINEDEMAGLFLPFTQADKSLARRFEGIGIGLAYVHAMVERLGGAIRVASAPGQGTCFTITLPNGAGS